MFWSRRRAKFFPLLYFGDLARSVEPMLANEDLVDHYIMGGYYEIRKAC